jgi:YHS domain-containing protein
VTNQERKSRFASLALITSMTLASPAAWAQSGTRQPAPGSPPSAGQAQAPVALRGYCPVCLVNMKKWVPGRPEFSVVYDGHTYRFPGQEQMQMFQDDPSKYTPALHGDCIVCLKNMNQRVPADLNIGQFHQGRVYFFPSDEQRQMFRSDPAAYADADLALGGTCSVCRVEMNQEVPGKPEFAVHHRGLRYQFPGPQQRDMFLANPEKYAVPPAAAEGSGPADNRQSSREGQGDPELRTVSIRGRTSCAGCDHGVRTLGDPDELGLAVVADDGQIYIVEGAHVDFPEIYEGRFESREVELRGRVVKRDKAVSWIDPEGLRLVEGR